MSSSSAQGNMPRRPPQLSASTRPSTPTTTRPTFSRRVRNFHVRGLLHRWNGIGNATAPAHRRVHRRFDHERLRQPRLGVHARLSGLLRDVLELHVLGLVRVRGVRRKLQCDRDRRPRNRGELL